MAPFGRSRREPSREGERGKRSRLRSGFSRIVAALGIVGVGTALAAILGTQDVDAWIVGLVVAVLSVVIAAVAWTSRVI